MVAYMSLCFVYLDSSFAFFCSLIQIDLVSASLIAGANLFVFATVYSYFVFFGREEEWDWMNDGL